MRFDYNYRDPKAFEGQLASTSHNLIDTGINKTGLLTLDPAEMSAGDYESYLYLQRIGQRIPYGRGVQSPNLSTHTPLQNQDYILASISASGNPIAGVAYYMPFYEKPDAISEPDGVPPNRLFGVLKKGDVYVYSETAVRKFDPVYCRVQIASGDPDYYALGRWRNNDDSGRALFCPDCYFLETTTGRGIVLMRVNFIQPRQIS